MQEALQIYRLQEALSGGMQPCSTEWSAAGSDDSEGPLLWATPAEELPVRKFWRRVPLAENQQRRSQCCHVPSRQLRFPEEGEPGAEAWDLKNAGEAKWVGEGAVVHEARDDWEIREWENVPHLHFKRDWEDWYFQQPSRREEEIWEEVPCNRGENR